METKVHPLEIFEDGKHNLGKFTPEQFESARELLWIAPQLLDIVKRLNDAFYVGGTSKALRSIMAETKDLIRKAEGRE